MFTEGLRTERGKLWTIDEDYGLQTKNFGLWTTDSKLQTANSAQRTDTVNSRPLFVDCRPRTAGCELKSMDCGLRTTDFGLTGTDCGYVLSSVMKVSPKVVMTSIDEYLGKCLIHNSIKLSMFAHSFSSYLLQYLKWMWLKKRIGRRPEGLETSVL